MKAPQDKAVVFTIVVIIVTLIIYMIMEIVASSLGMPR